MAAANERRVNAVAFSDVLAQMLAAPPALTASECLATLPAGGGAMRRAIGRMLRWFLAAAAPRYDPARSARQLMAAQRRVLGG
jgi:hypothetical protein